MMTKKKNTQKNQTTKVNGRNRQWTKNAMQHVFVFSEFLLSDKLKRLRIAQKIQSHTHTVLQSHRFCFHNTWLKTQLFAQPLKITNCHHTEQQLVMPCTKLHYTKRQHAQYKTSEQCAPRHIHMHIQEKTEKKKICPKTRKSIFFCHTRVCW